MKQILLTSLAAATLLGGCGYEAGHQSYFVEAGTDNVASQLGPSTMNNLALQTGEKEYAIVLAERFNAEVNDTINFAFNSTVIDAEARAILDQQADFIRQFPEVRFRVYGHTDAVGTAAYNKGLGLRRAQAVVSYFAARGISRSRLEAMVSFGETQPVVATPDRERRNRRTVTEVSGFVKRHPTIMDGKYAEVIYREYINSAIPAQGTSGISGTDFGTDS
ncbi:OmpA family protein [Shimia biformata]|uniref:OmpA family protein n=1 Tax=Shimia biformata TaxID=1294299 RepID=UPI0019511366|nr:OmpA family protein [Shimia biformata]